MLQHFRIPPRLQRLQPPPSAFCLCSLSSHSMKSFMCLCPKPAQHRQGRHQRSDRRPRRGPRLPACAHTPMRPRAHGPAGCGPQAAPGGVCVLNSRYLKCFQGSWETKANLPRAHAGGSTPGHLAACVPSSRGAELPRGACRREACGHIYLVVGRWSPHPHLGELERELSWEINMGHRNTSLPHRVPRGSAFFNP